MGVITQFKVAKGVYDADYARRRAIHGKNDTINSTVPSRGKGKAAAAGRCTRQKERNRCRRCSTRCTEPVRARGVPVA